MTPEEELALRRASAILRAVGIATVEFTPAEEEGPAVGRSVGQDGHGCPGAFDEAARWADRAIDAAERGRLRPAELRQEGPRSYPVSRPRVEGRVSVWNVARMGVYGETLVDAVRAFVASGHGEPL